MRVSFVGCPCSGKTTTAAMSFAQLKEIGIGCEFITEQARLYIAKKRFALGLKPEQGIRLTDEDQEAIMNQQLLIEEQMAIVIGEDHVVISDSSPLNSLLYMSEAHRRSPTIQRMTILAAKESDLVFYVPPVPRPTYLDPNRVHSEGESLAVDKTIPLIMEECGIWKRVIRLDGPPQARLSTVTSSILTKRFSGE